MILGINKGKERGGSLGASPLACDTVACLFWFGLNDGMNEE